MYVFISSIVTFANVYKDALLVTIKQDHKFFIKKVWIVKQIRDESRPNSNRLDPDPKNPETEIERFVYLRTGPI